MKYFSIIILFVIVACATKPRESDTDEGAEIKIAYINGWNDHTSHRVEYDKMKACIDSAVRLYSDTCGESDLGEDIYEAHFLGVKCAVEMAVACVDEQEENEGR